MLNVILFGPPNCGKGTQAELIKGKYRLVHLSTGDILRAQIAQGTALGLAAKTIMDRGDLVSDEIILGMIGDHVEANREAAGFLFDGFPRTVAQKEGLAKVLHSKGTAVHAVVSMLVNEDELRTRMLDRAKKHGRADDTLDVFEKRMRNYKEQTLPLSDLYKAEGLLAELNGVGTIEEVFARIEQALTPVAG
jgi:adenylate kinase